MPVILTKQAAPSLVYWDVANSSTLYTINGPLATFTTTSGGDEFAVISLTGVTTGKHYVEITYNMPSGSKGLVGSADSTADPNLRPSAFRDGWYMFMDRLQRVYFDAVFKEDVGDQMPAGIFTMGIKVDMDNFQMGLLDASGANIGAGPWSSLPATEIKIAAGVGGAVGETLTANFGQNAFVHTVPGGFNPGWPGYF